ncbi:MAG: type II secretion system protein [Proteobacteria bacterium]|nr:type II secretion system protein [Pseudomonadota bacterium]
MKNRFKYGFTLIEMMVVLTIMAVVCAISIPGIVEITYRNALTSMVNDFQQAAAKTRELAMQTRQAAVLEVRENTIWINLLDGAHCTADLAQRCLTNTGAGGTGEIDLDELIAESGSAMCGGYSLTPETNCTTKTPLPHAAFAICYSGRGELFVRDDTDDNMECGASTTDQASADAWLQACGTSTAQTIDTVTTSLDIYDGAVVLFNRIDGDCAVPIGVRRGVFFPSNGMPYSKIAP